MSTVSDFAGELPEDALVLALDTASPVVSVAIGRGGAVIASRSVELRRSSERLLALLDEVLAEAGASFAEIAGVVALSGPGSFTGLRVGLATVLGFHQATNVRVAALPTLPVLALAGVGNEEKVVWSAVDAIRGEWFVQPFRCVPGAAPRELAAPEIVSADELARRSPATLAGFGVGRLAALLPDCRWIEPAELAPAALRHAALASPEWDPSALRHPLYLRAPEATLPPPRPALPSSTARSPT